MAGAVRAEEAPAPPPEGAEAKDAIAPSPEGGEPKDAAAPSPEGAEPKDAAAPSPEGAEPRTEPAPAAGQPEETWIDQGHAFVEHRIFAPILRLDRFFSDEREIEAERAQSFLRWRSEVRVAEDLSRPQFTTGVRATLRLPGLNKRLARLRVVIAGETRDAVSSLFPRRPGGPITPEGDELGGGDAGLRFYLWDTLASHADLGGGFLVQLPPGVYGRLRLRWAFPVGKLFLTRYATTGFWRTDQRFGTTGAAEAERLLPRALVARVAGQATLSEVSRGVEWVAEAAVLWSAGERLGAQVGAAMGGATRLPVAVERYRIYTRLRRDIYRRWLFVELEPELAWPWTDDPSSTRQGRHRAWGVGFRLEVQFQGAEAPLAPAVKPPRPPEPKDPPPLDEPADAPPSLDAAPAAPATTGWPLEPDAGQPG